METRCQLNRVCRIRHGKFQGLGGWRKKVEPVAGAVRGHSSGTPRPGTTLHWLHLSASSNLTIIILPPARVLILPTARVFTPHPPPHVNPHAPSLPHRDIPVVPISHGKGSGKASITSASGSTDCWAARMRLLASPSALFLWLLLFPFLSYIASSNTLTTP